MSLREPFASLRGRTAVVTGGARGIGYEVATALRSVNMSVLLIDRDGDALDQAVDTLRGSPDGSGPVTAVTADLGSDDLAAVAAALDPLPPSPCG